MAFWRIFLLLSLFSVALSHPLPRPLIIQYPENVETRFKISVEELQLQCTSWRFAVETNNLSPWKTIPLECADYVKEYMMGRAYRIDLERVSMEAGEYAKDVKLNEDGKDVCVFDVDKTLLFKSSILYHADYKDNRIALCYVSISII